ncbi:MAG: hypothetical protein ACI9N1_000513 [Flavobacteriales bacterium]|jgi:hypothetical protein
MDYLKYIFYLGIVYVVFSMIWFFIAKIPNLILSSNRQETLWEGYILKTVQYYFIASLTILKASEYMISVDNSSNDVIYFLVGGIILYLYLYGKYERVKQFAGIKAGISMMRGKPVSNISPEQQNKYTPHLIGITIIFYIIALKYPELVVNKINIWFLSSINDFYNIIIIGFILAIIGFFFMISMVSKGITATGELFQQLVALLTGKPYVKKQKKNPFENLKNFGGSNNPFGGNGGGTNPFDQLNQSDNEPENVDLDDDYVDFEYVDEDDK